ncbi:MAG: metallophosphoesterase [Planctomycetes bacterium]|nr:metallophosphoesterase [Planctomycetota bacterium]
MGLITDIHEQVEVLSIALDVLRDEAVDMIVLIGDVVGDGEQLEETCRLLLEHSVVGVWGNHDHLLCLESRSDFREQDANATTVFLSSLHPRFEVAQCLFQHVEPWLNADDLADLWYFEGPPDSPERMQKIFEATSHAVVFAGHYHKWMLLSDQGREPWSGGEPVRLNALRRYFVAVGALCEGRFATFDTESLDLNPFNVSNGLLPSR